MKKITRSEKIEQELVEGITNSTDPLGEVARGEESSAVPMRLYGRGSGMVREGLLHRAVEETRRAAPLGRL